MSAIALRSDFDAAKLRVLAAAASDGDQVRRLLALALIYDGKSRSEAGRLVGMDRQILCDWAEQAKVPSIRRIVGKRSGGAPL